MLMNLLRLGDRNTFNILMSIVVFQVERQAAYEKKMTDSHEYSFFTQIDKFLPIEKDTNEFKNVKVILEFQSIRRGKKGENLNKIRFFDEISNSF